MQQADIRERMRADWNDRAREDAYYYVGFGGLGQDDSAFEATAGDVLPSIEFGIRRVATDTNASVRRALEVGCGPGRLIKTLSRHFGEIHGVDVSDEMIRLGRRRLKHISHAYLHTNDGASLAQFADCSFDFIYSYAVFQHIPSREVVLGYMREIERLLKPGGSFEDSLADWQSRISPIRGVALLFRAKRFDHLLTPVVSCCSN